MPSMQALVLEEIAKIDAKDDVSRLNKYLDEFRDNLPSSIYPSPNSLVHGGWARRFYSPNQWDSELRGLVHSEGHSKHYLDQKPSVFFEIIDQAIIDCGLNIDEVSSLQLNSDVSIINSKTLPVYIKLRELEYSHIDLTTIAKPD